MGLLSKIFNTDKLEYILREEEEFSVAAPENWNIEFLTVGDTITPDMWDQNKIKGPQLNPYFNKPIQILWIEDYKFDDGSIEFSVGLEIKGYEDWELELEDVNSLLKPEYKIVVPDNLDEQDDFNVEAPKEWNVTELIEGDYVTPDMYRPEIVEKYTNGVNGDYWYYVFSKPRRIINVYEDDFYLDGCDNEINSSWLKPEFKVLELSSLRESDEFSVEAPEAWNQRELKVGNVYNDHTGQVWDDLKSTPEDLKNTDLDWDSIYTYEITSLSPNNIWITKATNKKQVYNFTTEFFNRKYGPKLNAYVPTDTLNESDEFDVEAPDEWNVEILTVGDTITPDMLKPNNEIYDSQENLYITKIGRYTDGLAAILRNSKGKRNLYYLENINNVLKPQYKIFTYLDESIDDEFNVEAPDEWNFTELTVGDTITPDMWQDAVGELLLQFEQGKLFKKIIAKPVKIEAVYEGDDIYFMINGIDPVFTNDMLLPQYKVVEEKDLFESEDEFNVDAPKEWNEIELTVGDYITPEMWDQQAVIDAGEEDEFLNGETWTIDEVDISYIIISSEEGGFMNWDLQGIQSLLKPQYKIVDSINEEDEFNVEAPEEWNREQFSVGDIITPDMWSDEFIKALESRNSSYRDELKFWWRRPLEIVDIMTAYDEESETTDTFFRVVDPQIGLNVSIGHWNLHPDVLKKYHFGSIVESENEFDVEAPKEWNIDYLGIGDTITPDMWNKKEIKNVTGLSFNKPLKIWWIGTDGISGFIEFEGYKSDYLDVDFVEDLLKPQYKISLSNLNESDDEFSVEAPKEWNKEYLQIGDIITPDMWDTIHGFGFREPVYIIDVGTDDGGDYVLLNDKQSSNGGESVWDLDEINDNLKHPYKIASGIDLDESDDEFSVEAPESWNQRELQLGNVYNDYTGQVWDDLESTPEEFKNMNSNVKSSATYEIVGLSPKLITISRVVKPEQIYQFPIFHFNKEDGVKINAYAPEKINELDDEFNVEAPDNWNVIELTVGDTITPDMWKETHDQIKWQNNPITLTKFIEAGTYNDGDPEAIVFKIPGSYEYIYELDYINDLLKSEYRVAKPLNESDDEWSVEAPPEWDVFPIIITMTNEYTFYHQWDEDHDQLDEVKVIKTDSEELGEIIGQSIPYDAKAIENLIGNEFWDNDELMDFLHEGGKVVQAIPSVFYEEGWENQWEDYTIDVRLPSKMNENEFDVVAPEEWNEEIFDGTTDEDLIVFISHILGKYNVEEPYIDEYIDQIFSYGDPEAYEGVTERALLEDFNEWYEEEYNEGIDLYNDTLDESNGEFNVDAPENWNVTELEIGDIITPDMVNVPKDKRRLNYWHKIFGDPQRKGWKIIRFDSRDVVIQSMDDGLGAKFGIESVNNILKPEYRISTILSEQDDDFTVDAPKEWNVNELGVGDYLDNSNLKMQNSRKKFEIVKIFKNMWGTSVLINVHELVEEPIPGTIRTNKQWKITRQSTVSIEYLENKMKPGFKIDVSDSLDENEFTVKAPEEWNQKELTTGDTFNIGDNIYQIGEFDSDGRHVKVKRKKDNKYLTFPISLIQSKLPKNTILVKPTTKLSELLETDDDFTVDAPKEWNEIYLTIGDQITPEMWDQQAVIDAGDEEFLNGKTWTINDFVSRWVYMTSDGGSSVEWNVKDIQSLLKPQYRIVDNMNESDDEWSVDAPEEWDKIILTKGDYITPDMWKKIPNRFANPPQSVEIGGFGLAGDANDIEEVRLIKSDMSHVAYSFQLDDLNNELLKPQYQIVHLVGGNNKWKDLYEENESEDEFNVDAPEEWGLEPLTVGDTITPNMWKDIDKLKYRFQELGVESPTDVLIKKIQCWDTGLENDCVVRLVLKNPPLSLKRILKKSYYDSFGSPTYKSGWFNWFEWINIGELNNSLTSQYKVFPEDSPELN
jgi:hypothetical protein